MDALECGYRSSCLGRRARWCLAVWTACWRFVYGQRLKEVSMSESLVSKASRCTAEDHLTHLFSNDSSFSFSLSCSMATDAFAVTTSSLCPGLSDLGGSGVDRGRSRGKGRALCRVGEVRSKPECRLKRVYPLLSTCDVSARREGINAVRMIVWYCRPMLKCSAVAGDDALLVVSVFGRKTFGLFSSSVG